MKRSLADIIRNIEQGIKINSSEIVPYLSLENTEARRKTNELFAEAFLKNGSIKSKQIASNFLKRAFWLSGNSEKYLKRYVEVLKELNEFDEIKKAYKSVGIRSCINGDIGKAIQYFNLWQHTYTIYANIDKYEYDFEILSYIENCARQLLNNSENKTEKNKEKYVVGYLLRGINDSNSTYFKILRQFVKHANKQSFEVFLFVPESELELMNSDFGIKHSNELRDLNCKLITAPESDSKIDSYIGLSKKVLAENPDLIVTTAVMQDMELYFISSLLSYIPKISFIHGALPLFAPLNYDWSISQARHPMMESISDCSYVDLEFDLLEKEDISPTSKESLGIPDDAIVVLGIGRHTKFQDVDYLLSIKNILKKNKNVFLLLIGPSNNNSPLYEMIKDSDLESRVKFLGWVEDYFKIMAITDIMLDSYPFGGGIVILEALSFGVPVISFENDYLKEYDQTDWSLADLYIAEESLIVPRGDFTAFENCIQRLLNDDSYRYDVGEKCKEYVKNKFGSPKRMVELCERVYLKVLKPDTNSNVEDEYLDEIEKEILKSRLNILAGNNFYEWQQTYDNGYKSNMGDHSTNFYNENLAGLGLFDLIDKAHSIIEYGASEADFIKKVSDKYPDTKIYIAEYSNKLLKKLERKFEQNKNVELLLNYPEITTLKNIDLSFSFLLAQSMPKTLWIEHLKSVKSMLSDNGSYIFQFASHPDGYANDEISNGINGNNKYHPEEIYKMLEDTGYNGCDLSVPIDLQKLQSDITWYFCRAY